MKSFNVNFVNTYHDDSDKLSYTQNSGSETIDPLRSASPETTEPKCYKIDSIVFAEPLNYISYENNYIEGKLEVQDDTGEMTFIDNVVVQKKINKKYKKYHINIDKADLKCPQPNCTSTFSSTKLLKAHIRKVHCADRKKYMCEQCGAGFPAQYLLVRHTAVHSGEKVECPVCSAMLSGRTSLSTHLRTHSGLRPHSCSICSKSFTRSSILATHVKFVHSATLTCDHCDTSFSSRKQWNQHMKIHRRKKTLVADTS